MQSPALGLLHEVGHAARHAANAQLPTVAGRIRFTIEEEQTVVDNYETPAAKAFGQGVRVKYDDLWRAYSVGCSTCTK